MSDIKVVNGHAGVHVSCATLSSVISVVIICEDIRRGEDK